MENTTKTKENLDKNILLGIFILGTIVSIITLFVMVSDRPDTYEVRGISQDNAYIILYSKTFQENVLNIIDKKEFEEKCDKKGGKIHGITTEDTTNLACIVDNAIKDTYSR